MAAEWAATATAAARVGTERGGTEKAYRVGTHRQIMPEETVARIRPLMPVMGITRLANVTGLDRIGIPVVMVARPNSRSVAVSQGKGLSLAAAKASGLMEAVETYHAETIEAPLRLGRFAELRHGLPLVDVARLPMPAESRLTPERPILWIEGRDLVSGRAVWVPYELVHANYTLPMPTGSGCFVANTNGLASGNHRLEAILHGICELIERDATTLWRLRSEAARAATSIDLASVDDPHCQGVLAQFAAAGIDVRAWDVTTDVGLPCVFCLAIGRDDRFADPEFGAGCHLVREVALLRALTEAAQSRTTYIAGARDDIGPGLYAPSARARRLADCRELYANHPPRRPFSALPTWPNSTFEADFETALDRLAGAGLAEVVAVDLTKPAFRVPVVRVVIPGLEGAFEEAGGDYVPGERALGLLTEAQ